MPWSDGAVVVIEASHVREELGARVAVNYPFLNSAWRSRGADTMRPYFDAADTTSASLDDDGENEKVSVTFSYGHETRQVLCYCGDGLVGSASRYDY